MGIFAQQQAGAKDADIFICEKVEINKWALFLWQEYTRQAPFHPTSYFPWFSPIWGIEHTNAQTDLTPATIMGQKQHTGMAIFPFCAPELVSPVSAFEFSPDMCKKETTQIMQTTHQLQASCMPAESNH